MHTAVTTYVRDLLERVASTFAQAFLATLLGAWAASGLDVQQWNGVTDWSALKHVVIAAALGGLAASLSLVKGLAATWIGNKDSASLVDAPVAPPVAAPAAVAATPAVDTIAAPTADLAPELQAALDRAATA